MDKSKKSCGDHAQANRTNQCNPNHKDSGPGHKAGYHGAVDKADLDNHGQQCNPNNDKCGGDKKTVKN